MVADLEIMFTGSAFLAYAEDASAHAAIEHFHEKLVLSPVSIHVTGVEIWRVAHRDCVIQFLQGTPALKLRVAESQTERNNKLFVGMLPKTLTEDDLYTMFCPYGELKEVHVIRTPEGLSKGCAFVKFEAKESAVVAIQDLHDVTPFGGLRPLVVKFANGSRKKPEEYEQLLHTGEANAYEGGQGQYWMTRTQPPQAHPHSAPQHQQQMLYGYTVSGPDAVPPAPASGGAVGMQQMQYSYNVASNSGLSSGSQFLYVPSEPGYVFPPPQSQLVYPGQSHGGQALGQHTQAAASHHKGPQQGQLAGKKTSPTNAGSAMDPMSAYQQAAPLHMGGPGNDYGMGQQLAGVSGSNPSASPSVDNPGNSLLVGENEASTEDLDSARPVEGPVGANLFIYHLPRDLTDADLATLFSNFGEVMSAKVFLDKKSQESKGFG
jgi:CUG-BP- and ETR3-like factor